MLYLKVNFIEKLETKEGEVPKVGAFDTTNRVAIADPYLDFIKLAKVNKAALKKFKTKMIAPETSSIMVSVETLSYIDTLNT